MSSVEGRSPAFENGPPNATVLVHFLQSGVPMFAASLSSILVAHCIYAGEGDLHPGGLEAVAKTSLHYMMQANSKTPELVGPRSLLFFYLSRETVDLLPVRALAKV